MISAPQGLIGVVIITTGAFSASYLLVEKAPPKQCIVEKTVAEIVSVTRHETRIRYTDGTSQRVSTLNGVTIGDVNCLAYGDSK